MYPNFKLGGKAVRASLAATLLFAFIPAQVQAAGCMTADEAAAEQVRRLQTTLMVGALQCRNAPELRVRETYNSFIKRYGASISAHNRILTRYFQRTEGEAFQRVMDSHITQLANSVSRLGHSERGFCEKVAGLGQSSLSSAPSDIVTLAQKNTLITSKFSNCEPTRTQAAQTGS